MRFLLILILFIYILYKLGFFKVFVGSVRHGYDEKPNRDRTPPNGNVRVDSVPKERKRGSGSNEGEYIDYEEVK